MLGTRSRGRGSSGTHGVLRYLGVAPRKQKREGAQLGRPKVGGREVIPQRFPEEGTLVWVRAMCRTSLGMAWGPGVWTLGLSRSPEPAQREPGQGTMVGGRVELRAPSPPGQGGRVWRQGDTALRKAAVPALQRPGEPRTQRQTENSKDAVTDRTKEG